MKICTSSKKFTGRLTQDIRKKIQNKRTALGLTYYRMALFFNLDWTTIRKWEMGPTLSCNLTNRQRLQDFIAGNYDHEFLLHPQNFYDQNHSNIPMPVKCCMEKIINTYIVCKGNSMMKQRLQNDLDNTINHTLQMLTSSGSKNN